MREGGGQFKSTCNWSKFKFFNFSLPASSVKQDITAYLTELFLELNKGVYEKGINSVLHGVDIQ